MNYVYTSGRTLAAKLSENTYNMANFHTKYLEESEFSYWDSFVKRQPEGKVFHLSEWLRTIYRFQNPNITTRILICQDKQDNIIGGIAFGSLKKYGVSLIVPPELSQFWGILLSDRPTKYYFKNVKYKKEILETIIGALEKDYQIIDLSIPPDIYDIRAFVWKGYQQKIRFTYQGVLNDLDQIYEGFDPALKRQIKKAKKSNIKVEKGNEQQRISDLYQLQFLSLKRQNSNFHFSLEDFLTMVLMIHKRVTHISFYLAYLSDQPIAGCAVLTYKYTAYYWLAGGKADFFNTGANQMLLWEIFKDLNRKGILYFDFVGANTPSIAQYKSSYNFSLIPYYQFRKIIGIWPNLLLKTKESFL